MRVEVGPALQLAVRDTVLLASDGLFDNLYIDEIVDTIRSGPLTAAADRLVARVQARMKGEERGSAVQARRPHGRAVPAAQAALTLLRVRNGYRGAALVRTNGEIRPFLLPFAFELWSRPRSTSLPKPLSTSAR